MSATTPRAQSPASPPIASPLPDVPSLEGQYAGFVTRMGAFIIDILIINVSVLASTAVVSLIFGFFNSVFELMPRTGGNGFDAAGAWVAGFAAVLSLLVMAWLYPVVFWMINGQTIGKKVMGLRVVRMDGKPMTFWRGLARVFGYWVSAVPLFLGFIWVIFSNKRRGWHDMLANTCVIYSWDAAASAALQERLKRTAQTLTDRDDS